MFLPFFQVKDLFFEHSRFKSDSFAYFGHKTRLINRSKENIGKFLASVITFGVVIAFYPP